MDGVDAWTAELAAGLTAQFGSAAVATALDMAIDAAADGDTGRVRYLVDAAIALSDRIEPFDASTPLFRWPR